jgi:hypothetical protein
MYVVYLVLMIEGLKRGHNLAALMYDGSSLAGCHSPWKVLDITTDERTDSSLPKKPWGIFVSSSLVGRDGRFTGASLSFFFPIKKSMRMYVCICPFSPCMVSGNQNPALMADASRPFEASVTPAHSISVMLRTPPPPPRLTVSGASAVARDHRTGTSGCRTHGSKLCFTYTRLPGSCLLTPYILEREKGGFGRGEA